MRNNKGGFIATSLIYSFFLVFVAVIASLVNNYIANKTILDRYNENAAYSLNSESYDIVLIAKGAEIDGGINISNLAENSTFTSHTVGSTGNNGPFWNFRDKNNAATVAGESVLTFGQRMGSENSVLSKPNNSYHQVYQSIPLKYNHSYYYSIYYYQSDATSNMKVYLGDSSTWIPVNYVMDWTKGSAIYKSTNDYNAELVVGETVTPSSSSAVAYFTKVVVIDLDETDFGSGTPNKFWLDQNLDYFSGRVALVRINDIDSGENSRIRIKLTDPTATKDNIYIKCSDSRTGLEVISSKDDTAHVQVTEANQSGSYKAVDVVFKNVRNNMKCNIGWGF